jgi:hypothetical protein
MADNEVIRLDGRDFVSVDQGLTMAQNDYVLVLLEEIGSETPDSKETAADIVAKIARGDKSTDIGQRLLRKILKSGRASEVLAGLLTEKGKRWTRREALRNAEIFAEIRNSAEQVVMRGVVVSFVIGFFQYGQASSATSPKSSPPNGEAPDISNAEVAISESSPESSGK